MHRALSISELLAIVFSHLDQKSNLNNACVCRLWYRSTQPILWEDVSTWRDFDRLFSILAPLRWVDFMNKQKEFSGYPQIKDWARFREYSALVRTVSLDDSERYTPIFTVVAQTRPQLNLFPNIHTLEWSSPRGEFLAQHCVLFMHSNVTKFVASLPSTGYRQAQQQTESSSCSWVPLLVDSISRMPMLRHLEIRCDGLEPATREHLLQAMKGLRHLRTIILPHHHITAQIIEDLSLLPHLVELSSTHDTGPTDRLNVSFPPFNPILSKDAFPSLRILAFTADVRATTQLLHQRFFPATTLRRLHLEMPRLEPPGAIAALLRTVADTCPVIEEIAFRDQDVRDHRAMASDGADQIALDTLSPVFACPCLTTLEVRHHYPLALGVRELEALAAALPCVETLLLNEGPVSRPERSPLPLGVLSIFARACPKLRNLGLFIDASREGEGGGAVPLSEGNGDYSFPVLQSFSVGVSHIDEVEPVALFLAQVFPPGCQVTLSEPETRSVRRNKWRKVNEMLPVLAKMRMMEGERVRRRVKSLEMKLDALGVQE